jgi:very-short-patch-repair endonuclease
MSAAALTAEQRERYRQAGRLGGLARAQMPGFREHQRRAGKRCAELNDMAALGHRGAKVFIERYGYPRLWRLARAWRLEHPSRHERQVMAILDGWGLSYQREVELLGVEAYVSVDFLVAGTYVIEVNGKCHYDPAFDHPNYPNTRAAGDRERVRKLRRAGYQVLVIDYRDLAKMADLAVVRQRIAEFLSSPRPLGEGLGVRA